MTNFIPWKDKIFHIGDKFKANRSASNAGIANTGETVTLVTSQTVNNRLILGIYSEKSNKSWGDLDGAVPLYHGLWIRITEFHDFFVAVSESFIIEEDFNFKNKNLRGMRCKLLHKNSSKDECFVEFDIDVGGGSADGMCKTGRCVVVPERVLQQSSAKEEELKKLKSKKAYVEVPVLDTDTTLTVHSTNSDWLFDPDFNSDNLEVLGES
jgi:hypothetical protein